MNNITVLGPIGSTFSSDAWPYLVKHFGAPDGEEVNCIPAVTNADILKMVLSRGGYGAIATNTECDGKVEDSIKSFGGLLQNYASNDSCPFTIIGAVRLTLNFCLMARPGFDLATLTGIISHEKGLMACRELIKMLNVKTVQASSNGAAAEMVSTNDEYANFVALGPESAAQKFGLDILDQHVESEPAYTTFALVGPKQHEVVCADTNEAIVVFNIGNHPNALVTSLLVFADESLNLSHITSTHVANGSYNFTIVVKIPKSKILAFNRAIAMLKNRTLSYLSFGPYPVIEA